MAEIPESPDDDTSKPRRLGFREANLGPAHVPEPPVQPHGFFTKRKRTVAITLLAVGTGAAAIYGLTHRDANCGENSADQWTSGRATPCTHGSGGGWHGGYGFSSSGSSATPTAASRGGFGSSGSAHGGGGE